MARLLQYFQQLTSGSKPALVCVAIFVSGCLLSPPIEPYEEANLGPRIEPIRPDPRSAVKNVTREYYLAEDRVIEVSANLYDPNPEPQLHYVFLSDIRGELFDSVNLRSDDQGEDPDEYYFGQVERTFNPCEESQQLTIPGTETITLYVSDRGFYTTSPDPTQIEVVEGAIMVAYSWTLKYEAGLCDTGA